MQIRELRLRTGDPYRLGAFYGGLLGLPSFSEAADGQEISFRAGLTKLTFQQAEPGQQPVYHFAVNIPENKFGEAKKWISSKTALNRLEGKNETFFDSWNAHALYFEDPAGNIVEFIARHNLANGSAHPFTSEDWLEISEIGIAAANPLALVERLNRLGLPCLREKSETFMPVGDERGMVIVVSEGRRWFFSRRDAEFQPFEADIAGIGTIRFYAPDCIEVVP